MVIQFFYNNFLLSGYSFPFLILADGPLILKKKFLMEFPVDL